MRVLFVAAEVYPFAKTGGLADVSSSLPAALVDLDVDTRILMPAYPEALEGATHLREVARFGNVLGCGTVRLLETRLPGTFVPVWMVDCPELYNRAGGPYRNDSGADWHDNSLRFALLSHVAAGIANEAGGRWRPDVVHANDWHSGLLPLLLSAQEGRRPATLFTIHNLAYQGLFDANWFERLELPADSFWRVEFYGRLSFLKAGIEGADAITTVSPTYAREILSEEHGCGLEGLLRQRAESITGILNGADYGLWDPETDPHISCNYSDRSIQMKQACKRALQESMGLQKDDNAPVLGFMSRLVHQKTPDVLLQVLPSLIEAGMQFALVGEGDAYYEERFRALADRYPQRVAIRIGYEEPAAHRLVAGADMLVHPSRFEPCGLVPMYAMRYGTIPVVRNSGGMADTITDASPENMKSGTATGFSFDGVSPEELSACIRRATDLYGQPISWRKLQTNAMRQDFSWTNSAKAYVARYESVLAQSAGCPEKAKLSRAIA